MSGMRWRRLGLVHAVDAASEWMTSHAAYPSPFRLNATTVRVYFSTRDRENRSSVAWLDLKLTAQGSFSVEHVASLRALGPGARGAFDDSGASVGCILEAGGELR